MHSRTQGTEQTVPYRLIASIYHLWLADSLQLCARLNYRNLTRLFFFLGEVSLLETEDEGSRFYLLLALPLDLPRRHTSIGRCSSQSFHVISTKFSLVRLPSVSNTFSLSIILPNLSYPLFRDTMNGCWTDVEREE